MRKPFVGGNWKMHGTKAELLALLADLKKETASLSAVEIAVFPSFVYLEAMREQLDGSSIGLGAQNQCDHEQGAFTGDISPVMLKDVGCEYVLLGHSERRHGRGEDSRFVARKFALAKQNSLVPVLCVGETEVQRDVGETDAVVRGQLDAVIAETSIRGLKGAVIAYEPVWAIGTGKVATPDEVQAMHAMIRSHLARQDEALARDIRIIYGGSVKPDNAAEIFAMADVDGGLIGGASLKADQFAKICELAGRVN